MDSQHSGQVDRETFKAAGGSDTDFDRFDADHNGSLDQDELHTLAAAKAEAPAATVPLGRLLMHTPIDSPQSIAEVVAAARLEHEHNVEQKYIQQHTLAQQQQQEAARARRLQQLAVSSDRSLIAETVRQQHLIQKAEAKKFVLSERAAQAAAQHGPEYEEGYHVSALGPKVLQLNPSVCHSQ